MTPKILKGFNPRWYFMRGQLTQEQELQVEIASVYFSSADDTTKESLEEMSDQALLELSKIEKRKTVIAKVKSQIKKREKAGAK